MSDDEEPKIKFAGQWIPAHEAWDKMALSSSVKDVIKAFNQNHPALSTEASRRVVPVVEERLRDFELKLNSKTAESPDLAEIARGLLSEHAPEDVVDLLARKHNCDIDLHGLIALAGEAAYLNTLTSEARVLIANKILPGQTAALWNELGRPAPGGGLWSDSVIQQLLDDAG